MIKTIKILNMIAAIFLIGFFLVTFLMPGKSYLIKNGIFAGPISAAKLLTASISKITGNDNHYNILILGVPGEPNNAPYLTDTIMVAQIIKEDESIKVNTLSLPRDLLVEYNKKWTRINSLYVSGRSISHETGIDNIEKKVEEITGVDITNHIMIDTAALRTIVNQVGGINVLVPKDIYDPRFPGPSNSYETFEIKKGWRYLDGDLASRYARTRNDAESDFGRMKRQLQVIRALKDKIFALNPIWNFTKFLSIFKTLNNNIKTDFGIIGMTRLWDISQNIDLENINHVIIDNDPEKELIVGENVIIDKDVAAVLVPKEGFEKYKKIQEYINEQLTIND